MKEMPSIKTFSQAIVALVDLRNVRSATVYESPSLRVTATRIHKHNARKRHTTIAVTFGEPNYAGREFIKACKKAGEPLPVKKAQLRWWPKPKAIKRK